MFNDWHNQVFVESCSFGCEVLVAGKYFSQDEQVEVIEANEYIGLLMYKNWRSYRGAIGLCCFAICNLFSGDVAI
mgnify:CR=1 FL=1